MRIALASCDATDLMKLMESSYLQYMSVLCFRKDQWVKLNDNNFHYW